MFTYIHGVVNNEEVVELSLHIGRFVAIADPKDNGAIIESILNKRSNVIRAFFQHKCEKYNEYHVFDYTGNSTIIRDYEKKDLSQGRIVGWVDEIDYEHRVTANTNELRIYNSKADGVDSQPATKEENLYHLVMQRHSKEYFSPKRRVVLH